jgi:hypothetical protein
MFGFDTLDRHVPIFASSTPMAYWEPNIEIFSLFFFSVGKLFSARNIRTRGKTDYFKYINFLFLSVQMKVLDF